MFENEEIADHQFERVTKREKRRLAKQVRQDFLGLPAQSIDTSDVVMGNADCSAENSIDAYNSDSYDDRAYYQDENNAFSSQTNQDTTGYHFEKYLDVTTGSFYYLDTVSGETTWDKPPGSIPLQKAELSNENKEQREQEKLDAKRMAENRSYVLSKIRDERVVDHIKANAEAKLKADQEKKTIWRQALFEASLNKGSFHMEWKNLEYIDEEVATFNLKFSMPMVALR